MVEPGPLNGSAAEAKDENTTKSVTEYESTLLNALQILQGLGTSGGSRAATGALRYLPILRNDPQAAVLINFLLRAWKKPGSHPNALHSIAIEPVIEILKTKRTDANALSNQILESKSLTKDCYSFQSRPAVLAFLLLVAVAFLLDHHEGQSAMALAEVAAQQLSTVDERHADPLKARLYYFFAFAAERSNQLPNGYQFLMDAHRIATLQQDYISTATLINCILRHYVLVGNYEAARKFATRVAYPEEARSNTQYVRYQYYLGRIEAVRLDYSNAHIHFQSAMRKMSNNDLRPSGFRLSAQKFSIVVQMLMGEIPDRRIFNKAMRIPLMQYFELATAVRSGDIEAFGKLLENNHQLFVADETLELIERLRLDVIWAALRTICRAYSRITLEEVAHKIKVAKTEDAEAVVAKAIIDGVIDAVIDAEMGVLKCTEQDKDPLGDPTIRIGNRIAMCHTLQKEMKNSIQYAPVQGYPERTEADIQRAARSSLDLEDEDGQPDEMDLL